MTSSGRASPGREIPELVVQRTVQAQIGSSAADGEGLVVEADFDTPSGSGTSSSSPVLNMRGAVTSSTAQPTSITGTATGAKENIPTATPAEVAIPAISRLELVPMRVVDPAKVVAWAMGRSTRRAGIWRVCCSSRAAGMSMATIGVVLIIAENRPMGAMSRSNTCVAEVTVLRSRQVTRETAGG